MLTRPRLLIVMPRAPWPPRLDGIAVRYVPILQRLHDEFEIDLVSISSEQPGQLPLDAGICSTYRHVQLPRGADASLFRKLWYRAVELLPWTPSLLDTRYFCGRARAWLLGEIGANRYDAIVWVSRNQLVTLSALLARRNRPPVVVDLIDSPSLAESRDLCIDTAGRLLKRYRLEKTRALERKIARYADALIYVSTPDAAEVARTTNHRNLSVVRNGVYIDDLGAEKPVVLDGRYLGFLGSLDYPPNSEAAIRLAKDIFPRLVLRFPDLKLLIIGRNPPPALCALRCDRIVVTGAVESIWPYVDAVAVFAFPMLRGAGLQNKVIEAMFRGKSVVLPRICNASVGSGSEEHVLVAESDDDFVHQIGRLLQDGVLSERIGTAARVFAMRHYRWEEIVEDYRGIIGKIVAAGTSGQPGSPSTVEQHSVQRVSALRISVLWIAKLLGLFRLARLLTGTCIRVLCYHALDDELCRFRPFLFMRPAVFRSRLQYLHDRGFRAVTLEEAREALRSRSRRRDLVVITFDDGWRSIAEKALPLLEAYRMPATLYVATYYVQNQVPVFDVTLGYCDWIAERRQLPVRELGPAIASVLDSQGASAEQLSRGRQLEKAIRIIESSSLEFRESVLGDAVSVVGAEAAETVAAGAFHYSCIEELASAQARGLELQLHTHTHCLPDGAPNAVAGQIESNRQFLARSARQPLKHFCYPSGYYTSEHLLLLATAGIETATTTKPGLWGRNTPQLEIPRFVDADHYPSVLFEAEISGFMEVLRKLRRKRREAQFVSSSRAAARAGAGISLLEAGIFLL